jgi:hypothetical protein
MVVKTVFQLHSVVLGVVVEIYRKLIDALEDYKSNIVIWNGKFYVNVKIIVLLLKMETVDFVILILIK